MAVFTGMRLAAMLVLPLFVSDVLTPLVPPVAADVLLAVFGPDVALRPDTEPPALVLVLVALAVPPFPPVAEELPPLLVLDVFPTLDVLAPVLVLPTLAPAPLVLPLVAAWDWP